MKSVYKLNDRPSYQNKELSLTNIFSIDPPVLVYKINCVDKNTGNPDFYIKMDYIPEDGKDVITSIDFDGGPKLSIGSVIEDAEVVGFLHDDFENVRVLLKPVDDFTLRVKQIK